MSTKQHLQNLLSRARKVTWYPGHMQKSLRLMQERLSRDQIGCVLEVRDSRVPLSSLNLRFEQYLFSNNGTNANDGQEQSKMKNNGKMVAHKNAWGEQVGRAWSAVNRITVFNKTDLVDSCALLPSSSEDPEWRKMIRKNSKYPAVFASCHPQHQQMTANQILELAVGNWLSLHKETMGSMPNCPYPPLNIMVIGLPNTGKSSIINLLRSRGLSSSSTGDNNSSIRKDVCSVAKVPGHTRSVSSKIKVIDTETISLSSTSVSHANALVEAAEEKRHLELPVVRKLRKAGVRLKVYVMDSPGILQPHFVDPVSSLANGELSASGTGLETGIKLGLVGCMPTDLGGRRGVCPLVVAEYLWIRISERWSGLKGLVGQAYGFPVIDSSSCESVEEKRKEFTRFLEHYYREEMEAKGDSVSLRRSDQEKLEIAAESFIRAWKDGDIYQRIGLFPSNSRGSKYTDNEARRKMTKDLWRLTMLDDEFMQGPDSVDKWFKDRYSPAETQDHNQGDDGKIPISIAGSTKVRIGDLYVDEEELMTSIERKKLRKKQEKLKKNR